MVRKIKKIAAIVKKIISFFIKEKPNYNAERFENGFNKLNEINKIDEECTMKEIRGLIKEEVFNNTYPHARPQTYQALLDNLDKYGINTKQRVSAFISQCGHESGGFRFTEENLNYSASALDAVFAKYFKNAGVDSNLYARQPEKIANIVYANRMGNSDTASGDGWKYRGRGFIQLTGKHNYAEFQKTLGVDLINNPELVHEDINLCVISALWYWDSRNLNPLADVEDILGITKIINGGYNGLDDRKRQYEKLMNS